MRLIIGVLAILVVLALGLVAWLFSGAYDVSAQSDGSKGAAWLAATATRQSVRAHAKSIVPPSQPPEPLVIEEGAKLYQASCVACHGAPGQGPQPFALAMRPPGQSLDGKVGEWTPSELFWIIRNGIARSGMPAWPIYVDSEIWSLVAFLGQLPGMEPARYQAIVVPPPPPAPPESEPAPAAEGEQPSIPPSEEEPAPAENPAQPPQEAPQPQPAAPTQQ